MTAITCAERVWEFVHPETGCVCRAEYDHGLLVVEVVNGPKWLNAEGWWDEDAIEDAVGETFAALDKAGVSRTHIASAESALRELRLVSDVIREIV